MKVFISWSGKRSKFIAKALKNWLPKVIQSVSPWMSEEDILVGSRWSIEIAQELDDTNFGIICITPENQNKPWILFEAGALSKSLSTGNVSPVVYGMNLGQVSGPLSSFQGVSLNKDGIEKLLTTINKLDISSNIKNEEIPEIFSVWWPLLEKKIKEIPAFDDTVIPQRTNDDILDELLTNTRELLRRDNIDLEVSLKNSGKMKEEFSRMKEALNIFSELKLDVTELKEKKEEEKSKQIKLIFEKIKEAGLFEAFESMLDGFDDVEHIMRKLHGETHIEIEEVNEEKIEELPTNKKTRRSRKKN